jgi:hypothetical protein
VSSPKVGIALHGRVLMLGGLRDANLNMRGRARRRQGRK